MPPSMKQRILAAVVTAVALVAAAPTAGSVAAAPPLDDTAGALVGASRADNARPTTDRVLGGTSVELDARLRSVLELTNAERTARGVAPLRLDVRLNRAAQAHSDEQAARGAMSHTGADGSSPGDRIDRTGYRWSRWAENVAAGYGSADAVVRGWMGSDGHRRNILNPQLTELGLGVAVTPSGTPYWTQVFATPA